MINTTNIEEAKKLLKKEETPKIVLSQNDEFNRKILEHGNFDILLSPETGQRKNKIRQVDSGLNHVLAKIANKNNIASNWPDATGNCSDMKCQVRKPV